MIRDRDLIQSLNLLRAAPTFVFREYGNRLEVAQVSRVPNDGSVYWVSGESLLPTGLSIPSVFVVEHGGGNLIGVYWFLDSTWYKPNDADALAALGLSRQEAFPFDWRYAVPVENDSYHRES